MNKLLTRHISIVFIIFITACSYKPIFIGKDYNFEINEITLTGEKDINNIIKNKLNSIKKNSQSDKTNYDILINTKKIREIFSKDTKGDPSKFDIILTTDYEVKENGKLVLKRTIESNNTFNNDTDKFQLEQNEKMIVENLSEKIGDEIISSIINLNDN
tara:strand:+ start:1292 stop:1768 length:477 start_codon:yes stop_codon:yes gene_type:complete